MEGGRQWHVRRVDDAELLTVGRLLHDFNEEFGDVTPDPAELAERLAHLIATGDTAVLVEGEGPEGLVVLRLRPSLWTAHRECYLAELYVRPQCRGNGLGRALMEAAISHARAAGADRIELGTSQDDVAAMSLYESLGFSNREGGSGGPTMYVYERDL